MNDTATGADAVTNIDSLLARIDDLWAPHLAARVNDHAVKVVRVLGEHVWHSHHDTDELFLVLSGELQIDRRDTVGSVQAPVRLGPNDVHVVPRGVEHRPRSSGGATLLLIEPLGTSSTGDFAGRLPTHITRTTGLRA